MESSTLSWSCSITDAMKIQKKCFFIDDDEDDRDFFCTAVQSIDSTMECHFASNGISALEKLREELAFMPDFIFIDMNMPMMDGTECLCAIRNIPRLTDVPVFMYSTLASPTMISEAIGNGAAQFLIKPSTMTGLAEMLMPIIRPEK